MSLVRLILLGICVTGFVTIKCQDCSNGAGHCYYSTSHLYCYTNNNDTMSIKALLRNCASYNSSFNAIYVYKNYVSNKYAELLIDIELPSNIESLFIYNHQDHDHIRLTVSSQNIALTRIYTYAYIELESNDFFTHFTGLQSIEMSYVISRKPPSFSNLSFLTYLRVYLVGPVAHALDDGIVSGLTNLVILILYNSYFNGIARGAFRGMNKLTYLNLGKNEIAYIEDDALTELSSLGYLYLFENELLSVSDNIFGGLTDLSLLDLDNNPGFPLNALIQAKSVISLYLRYNGYHTLDPYVFQQMDSLKYLYLSDPFACDCKLQWASLVEQYELYIRFPVCLDSSGQFSRSITNQSLYTDCSQTESFQCFSKSITCPSFQVCLNTETSYSCGCPRGYVLPNSGQCIDTDECNEATNCQHTCVNTDGSYYCACDEGYELASDGYSCDDVNECLDLNGGCEFGCLNTIGSYQCQCHYGLELINKTHCDTEIQCIVVQNIENEDNRFSCAGNYNLTVTNFTCENIPLTPTSTIIPTTATTIPSPVLPTTELNGFPIGYEIQCDVIQDDDSQENHYTCSEGFNLTINKLTCNISIDHAVVDATYTSGQIQAPTIIVFTILIFIIAIQTVIIILILLFKLKGMKLARNPKVHRNMRHAHFQENVEVPLEEIIEKQSNKPSNTTKPPDILKVNPTYKNLGIEADHTYDNVDD